MHDKRSEHHGKRDPAFDHLPPVKVKPEAKIPAANARPVQFNGALPAAAPKPASLRHSKSFNSKDSIISKVPKSNDNSKISNNSEVAAAPLSSAGSGGNLPKSNSTRKSDDTLAKPRQTGTVKSDMVQPAILGRSEKVKSPGVLKNSSSKVNVESQKKNSKEASPVKSVDSSEADKSAPSSRVIPKFRETSPKPALAHVKSLSLSLNADLQKKLPPIKTTRTPSAKSSSAKNLANLCAECRAEAQGVVCFIGNDGRVSACSSRNAVRLCKNLKCANHNPEYVASMAAAVTAPKRYLVSRRHSLTLPRSSVPNSKTEPGSDKVDAQTPSQNGSESESGDLITSILLQPEEVRESDELDMKGVLEEDAASADELNEEVVEMDGIASASPHGGRLNGYQRMRRRSFSVVEPQAPPEMVTLRKQMMQERRHAEEWMLDYAIEEALQKLGPSKESKVKALVEAFESVTIPQKEVGEAVAQDHRRRERPRTPTKIAVKA